MTRVYLDELPKASASQIGIAILELIVTARNEVPAKAQSLLRQVRDVEGWDWEPGGGRIDYGSCLGPFPWTEPGGVG